MSLRLFRGEVSHVRCRPVRHRLRYAVFFIALDVENLPPSRWWFRVDQAGLIGFRCRDHGSGDGDLGGWARRLLAEGGMAEIDGRIELQCFPRMLGYAFKPVSFWYCHDRQGRLRAVLAEVNNTFGERHVYLLSAHGQEEITPRTPLAARKLMYVSPFCAVRGHYQFQFQLTESGRGAVVNLHDQEGLVIATYLSGREVPATAKYMLRACARFPLQSLSIVTRIYWHALQLWWKRVPWFGHPPPPAAPFSCSDANLILGPATAAAPDDTRRAPARPHLGEQA